MRARVAGRARAAAARADCGMPTARDDLAFRLYSAIFIFNQNVCGLSTLIRPAPPLSDDALAIARAGRCQQSRPRSGM